MKTKVVLRGTIFIMVTFVLYGIPLYVSQKLLAENFHENGEAYFKGAGHLLQENFKLGFCISVIDQVFWTAILSFLLFVCLDKVVRKFAFRLIFAIFLLTLTVVLNRYWKEALNYEGDYHNFCRSVDILSKWTSRIFGLTLSYLVANFGLRKDKSTNH
jgi:hypothetical protein